MRAVHSGRAERSARSGGSRFAYSGSKQESLHGRRPSATSRWRAQRCRPRCAAHRCHERGRASRERQHPRRAAATCSGKPRPGGVPAEPGADPLESVTLSSRRGTRSASNVEGGHPIEHWQALGPARPVDRQAWPAASLAFTPYRCARSRAPAGSEPEPNPGRPELARHAHRVGLGRATLAVPADAGQCLPTASPESSGSPRAIRPWGSSFPWKCSPCRCS